VDGVAYHVWVFQGDVVPPENLNAEAVDDGEEQHFRDHGVTQADRRLDNRPKPQKLGLGNDVPFAKQLNHRAHAPVHHQLGDDEQRQRDEEANVQLQIEHKGHGHGALRRLALEQRDHQQRKPRDQNEDGHALAHQREGVIRKVRAAQELEQRSAEHQREIRFALGCVDGRLGESRSSFGHSLTSASRLCPQRQRRATARSGDAGAGRGRVVSGQPRLSGC